MLGDSTYDILEWHDSLLEVGIVPATTYNPRNTNYLLDVEFRVEDRIKEHSEEVQLKHSLERDVKPLHRSRTHQRHGERLGSRARPRPRLRPRMKKYYVALCLRTVITIGNHEQGHGPRCKMLKLWIKFCDTALLS